jgi:hypothetical protein
MVKTRKPERKRTAEEIEAFIGGADTSLGKVVQPIKQLDPGAKHDFKSIRVGLNEYEYDLLTRAANQKGLTKVGFIRLAALEMAKSDQ